MKRRTFLQTSAGAALWPSAVLGMPSARGGEVECLEMQGDGTWNYKILNWETEEILYVREVPEMRELLGALRREREGEA